MQSALPASSKAILEALLHAGNPLSLDALFRAGAGGLSRTGIYRNLQAMVEEGYVERRGERQGARYMVREQMRFDWTLRLGGFWRTLEWKAEPPFDLRFPLASRLRDPAGRQVLFRFLEEAQDRRLDQPWRWLDDRFQEGAFDGHLEGVSDAGKKEFHRWIRDPSTHGGITVIAFGSCARGAARHDSDLDLLVVTPFSRSATKTIDGKELRLPELAFQETLENVAYDLEASSPRAIDLKIVEHDRLVELPPGLIQAIIREGITVHASWPSSDWVETWEERWKEEGGP